MGICRAARDGDALLLGYPNQESPGGTGGKRRHPVPSRIPASERTSRELDELLTHGVADGDARAELLKLAVRRIVRKRWRPRSPRRSDGSTTRMAHRDGYRRGRLRIL
jgi:hypothetical protein